MTELVGRYKGDRVSLPAVALTSDGTLMSCIGNDYGWDQVFVRQLGGLSPTRRPPGLPEFEWTVRRSRERA